jgi:antitoxin component YwqK of YwqJK toxin-antitoxin module
MQKGIYKNGLESGYWEFYNASGKIEYSGNYEKGNRVGEWSKYDKNGKRKTWKY